MKWVKMLFLGDSLTSGERDSYGLAWPWYMAMVAREDGVTILPEVLAVPGRTSAEMLRACLPTIELSDAKEVFILIGTNDAKDEVRTPQPVYRTTVQLVLDWCAVLKKRAFLLTIPLPQGFGSPGYTKEIVPRIRAFNAILRSGVKGYAALVDCEDVRWTVDGIHLTPAGGFQIASRAWEAVKRVRTFI